MQALLYLTLIIFIWGKIGGIIKKTQIELPVKPTVTEIIPSIVPSPISTPQSKKEVKGASVTVHVSSTSTGAKPSVKSNLDFYTYPSSKVISNSSTNLVLETNDDSKTVTDWYKNKIKDKALNVQSFVTTNTNDQILNKLVATDGNTKVEVDINGHNGSTLTISITIS